MSSLTRRQALAISAAALQGVLPRMIRGQNSLPNNEGLGQSYSLLTNASTNQVAGKPFRLSAAVMRLGVKERYRGNVTFRSSDPAAVLPAGYGYSAADDRYENHLFEVTLNSPGTHRIVLRDETTGTEFESNPIVVSPKESKYKLYFGDIHIHSAWSPDAAGDPDYNYIYARDAMNLDFACLTEHDPTDEIWKQVQQKAGDLYVPGKFATMSAYEWTAHKMKAGHKNVYYRAAEGPLLRSDFLEQPDPALHIESRSAQTSSAADLWAKLRAAGKSGKDVMTIPHHPAAKAFPVPWDQHDPEFQTVVEIYSSWGNSEYDRGPRQIIWGGGAAPGHFVQDALAAGLKLGFVGASDSHGGRPGYPAHDRLYFQSDYTVWEPWDYTGGFTGVYAEDLSREAIFDAIRMRRCYATTAKRILLDFRADGHWMGEEYKSANAPHLEARIEGTAPIASVTIVKNNRDYLRIAGNQRLSLHFQYGRTEKPSTTDYYYLRVLQTDGEMAWSSPIWISKP